MISSRELPKKTSCCTSLFGYIPRIFPEKWLKRFKTAAYLPGNFATGKGLEVPSSDGRGFGRLIESMTKAALLNSAGQAYCYLSPYSIAFLPMDPKDIEEFMRDNTVNVYMHDVTESFEMFFGRATIFAKEHGSGDYKKERTRFNNFFTKGSVLSEDAKIMQSIVGEHIKDIKKSPTIDVDAFASHETMEVIGNTKLGFKKRLEKETATKVATIVSEATTEVASGHIQMAKIVLPKKTVQAYFPHTRLGKLLTKGEGILREEIIFPNAETIRETENWLSDKGLVSDLSSHEILNAIKEIFIAGHDTTKVLLAALIRLLADTNHVSVVEKLREEVAGFKKSQGEVNTWERADIVLLPYLECVVQEALRLYPPIPDMVFKAKHPFKFAGGDLYPGDLVFLSSRAVHRDPRIWGRDAHEFKPERFLEFKADANPYQYFPFGFKPKICPGQHFAKQSVKFTLVKLLEQFDFEFVNKELHHPFPYQQVFTLRFNEEHVKVHFKLRKAEESKLEMPVKYKV